MEEEISENRIMLKFILIRIGRVNIDYVYYNGMIFDFNYFLDLEYCLELLCYFF